MIVNGLRGHTTRAICESIGEAILSIHQHLEAKHSLTASTGPTSRYSAQRVIMDADWAAMQKRFPSVVALACEVAVEADNNATKAVEEVNSAANDIAKVK